MRGSLKQRYKGSWSLILDLGRETDPTTGTSKRKQKWQTFRGTRKQAEAMLTELISRANGGTFVEPSKTTLLDYLRLWLEKAVKPPMRRPETYRVYQSIINKHIAKADLALMPLQQVRTSDLERYYATLAGAATSVSVHHAVLHRALKQAVRDQRLTVNPAAAVENRRRPKQTDRARHAQQHCWTAGEARAVLAVAKTVGGQLAAFSFLALDSGARKSELHGLTWSDLDLDAGMVTIARQLDRAGLEPVYGPTKTDRARTIPLGADTLAQLRAHKRAQAVLKLKNRTVYRDFGLIFAREPADLHSSTAALGQPLKTLSETRFQNLVAAAGVRRIKFHGVRHTVATLLLAAGVPVHVVAQRLGHAEASMTLNVYAHVLPSMQQDAAAKLAAVLHS